MTRPKEVVVPTRSIDTKLVTVMVLLAAATIVVHVVSSRPPRLWMWGAHFYSFFPTWVLAVSTIALAAIVFAALFRRDVLVNLLDKGFAPPLQSRRFAAVAVVAVAVGTAWFWFARISHTYLGDGNIIVEEIDTSQQILEREPLTSVLQYAVYRTTKPWFDGEDRAIEFIARDALAPGSVASGAIFLVVAWLLASEIARLRKTRDPHEQRLTTALVWLVILLQGYIQLFFGYIENYTFYAVGITVYLWLALRTLRGASPLLHPALALILCFALHLSSLVLGLSFAALTLAQLLTPERRHAAVRDLAISAAAVTAVGLLFMKLREGYNPFATLLFMLRTAFDQTRQPGYMWSQIHFRDFFNEQILIGPLGMFLFVIAALITLPKGERRATAWFVLIAGLGFLVACWMIGDSNLGYARDWDLLSHSGIVFTVAGLVLLMRQRMRHATAVAALACAIATSAYHTVPWIAVNANEERSLARLKTLPLGLGRTEVVVSTWYRQRGQFDQQRYWLKQAIARNPGNVNALYLLGALDYKLGRFQEAIPTLEAAVRIRPTKLEFRTLLAQSLYAVNRLEEALPHLEMVADADPRNAQTLMTLGESYYVLGRSAESLAVFQRAEAALKPHVERNADDPQMNMFYGFTLYRCNRYDEAIGYLQEAVALDPNSPDGHCFLGYALRAAGRPEEAETQFRACLTVNPNYAARGEIESWLATR